MIIRHLHVKNLKLLRDFELSFEDERGKLRMWTVIIGENGTAKTSLLQAIAMAAAGELEVNSLATKVSAHLRDMRQDGPLEIVARFGFLHPPRGSTRTYPGLQPPPAHSAIEVVSSVRLGADDTSLQATSSYVLPDSSSSESRVLNEVRSKNYPHWFVAGYGIARMLPDAGKKPDLLKPSIERMAPLFDSDVRLTSTAFANYFDQEQKGLVYSKALKRVLFHVEQLLPAISDFELRGHGGVKTAGDLVNRNRFELEIAPGITIKVAATALSHGYQSTIAWLADLVGHIILEAKNAVDPDEMQGLVLIDELDLYLHPTWQLTLVSALRKTFPQMQFVATTHSPLVLAGLRPSEIVRLQPAPSGDIVRAPLGGDPRVMTGTEIYREYFGIDEVIPDEAGQDLRNYRYLAANPYRTDEDDREIARLRQKLQQDDLDPEFEPVPRLRG